MALFKKNKKDEDFDDEEIEVEESQKKGSYQRRLPKSKGFKDLKSENKRKRKEPLKPWGKRERFLVFFLILATAGFSGYLAIVARNYKLPGIPRFKMPVISLTNLMPEEIIVIEGGSDIDTKAEKAISAFKNITVNLSGVYGLYVSNLTKGYSYGIDTTEVFGAASLIKLPAMIAMYIDSENGSLDLDEKYTLKSTDKKSGAGSLYTKPEGYQITYRNLIRLMGKESDNTAFNIARKYLGDTRINETAAKIGMRNTNIGKNQTTPEDVGIFFEELWNGNIIGEKNRDEFLSFMTDTVYEDWLALGIPSDVTISHKYGRETHIVNDAGIVMAKVPFVLVILSKGVVEQEADKFFPDLARVIYEAETSD